MLRCIRLILVLAFALAVTVLGGSSQFEGRNDAVGAAPLTLQDEGGANDAPGQKDLTLLTVDYAGLAANPSTVAIGWNWDEITLTGKNTADACALIDTNGNARANYALCKSWSGNHVAGLTSLYRCNADAAADRCGNAVQLTSPLSSCEISIVGTDPFPTGAAYPQDTAATCTLRLADLAGATTASVLNICALPSNLGSAPSDCVLVPRDGFIVIAKNASAPGTFSFTLDGQATPYTVVAGSPSSPIPVRSDINHSLMEIVPPSWRLDSASCTLPGGSSTGTFANPTITNIDVQPDSTTTCTFNNTLLTPALSLSKSASPTSFDTYNQLINYTYVVTNTGNVALAGPVTVTDNAAVACPPGGLLPSASMMCTGTYNIVMADFNRNGLPNVATAHANGTDSNTASVTITAIYDGTLNCGESTPLVVGTGSPSVTYHRLVNLSGSSCQLKAYKLSVSPTGETIGSSSSVRFRPTGPDADAQFTAVITWPNEAALNPITRVTSIRFHDGDLLHPVQWCAGTYLSPQLPGAERWCLTAQSSRLVGTGLIQVTEEFYGVDDPYSDR